jgi:hypothetical protein
LVDEASAHATLALLHSNGSPLQDVGLLIYHCQQGRQIAHPIHHPVDDLVQPRGQVQRGLYSSNGFLQSFDLAIFLLEWVGSDGFG